MTHENPTSVAKPLEPKATKLEPSKSAIASNTKTSAETRKRRNASELFACDSAATRNLDHCRRRRRDAQNSRVALRIGLVLVLLHEKTGRQWHRSQGELRRKEYVHLRVENAAAQNVDHLGCTSTARRPVVKRREIGAAAQLVAGCDAADSTSRVQI